MDSPQVMVESVQFLIEIPFVCEMVQANLQRDCFGVPQRLKVLLFFPIQPEQMDLPPQPHLSDFEQMKEPLLSYYS